MVMTLVLDVWETLSLTAGCNLYSKNFRFCVLTVKKAEENSVALNSLQGTVSSASSTGGVATGSSNMYFRERDRPVVDADTFLATALPKILMALLIIFLNGLAIVTLVKSNRWMRNVGKSTSRNLKTFLFLPQSTQGLLHSLFITYLILGLVTLYSQISLSTFILAEVRIVAEQGQECLVVNCCILAISVAIGLHMVSLAVDRTLAAYLSYNKYTQMARGTVPLWLLAIWLPSGILGALPLAGWRNNFSFCVFMHQFNDDYLRFVSGFFFACIGLIPCLYFYFLWALRPNLPHCRTLPSRWHRKLQSHHKLTCVMILAVNTVCWSPFHLYLLLACLTCLFPSFGTGFLQEYLYIIALVPSIIIPMMFTIRSNVLDQCAFKISRFVHFREDDSTGGGGFSNYDANPLSRYSVRNSKSPLFYIDQFRTSTYQDTLSKSKGTFFVPKFLPSNVNPSTNSGNDNVSQQNATGPNIGAKPNKYIKNTKGSGRNQGAYMSNNRGDPSSGYQTGDTYPYNQGAYNNPAFLRGGEHEPIYANGDIGGGRTGRSSVSTQETDSQCGFPIRPSTQTTATNSNDNNSSSSRSGSRNLLGRQQPLQHHIHHHQSQGIYRALSSPERDEDPYYSSINILNHNDSNNDRVPSLPR